MGNSSSHTHEPLERGFTRGKFGDIKNGKSASFRFSKRSSPKKMDRLRRSFRDSFRRRKDRVPESSKPHQWQSDEEAVRMATCTFAVKYLGCVEVFESRGMQVCEEALKVLRNSRRRPVRGLLHVSGDGLRVVDDETKGLIVDQTIEKVSFCAPDRNHERGFSYICRDGTTRRWMCHGFLACKESGERLSHAVGCAFAVCLERKQRRDKECGVTMSFDMKNSTFTRTGSFRQQTLTERLATAGQQQQQLGGGGSERGSMDAAAMQAALQSGALPPSAAVPPQPKPFNPFAIERPHATPSMLERQGSFRAFSTIGTQSPFKRQMSLRINDLPSNAERQKAFMAAAAAGHAGAMGLGVGIPSLTSPNRGVSPIPELSPGRLAAMEMDNLGGGGVDTVSQLCQELSQGLSLLSQTDALLAAADDLNFNNSLSVNQNIIAAEKQAKSAATPPQLGHSSGGTYGYISGSSSGGGGVVTPTAQVVPRMAAASPPMRVSPTAANAPVVASVSSNSITTPTTPIAVSPIMSGDTPTTPPAVPSHPPPVAVATSASSSSTRPIEVVAPLPNADQWLGRVVKATSPAPLKRGPQLTNATRTQSMAVGSGRSGGSSGGTDPFDAEWVAGVTKPLSPDVPAGGSVTSTTSPTRSMHSTNPFISPPKPPAQSFQVQL